MWVSESDDFFTTIHRPMGNSPVGSEKGYADPNRAHDAARRDPIVAGTGRSRAACAAIVLLVTQQQWGQPAGGQAPNASGGRPPAGFGQQGGFGQSGFGQSGFGQPGFGQPALRQATGQPGYGAPQGLPTGPGFGGPGIPQYGPPPGPTPRRSNPLRTVLLALIALTVVAIVGLVVVNNAAETSNVAYQNDDYVVPPPDPNAPPIPQPEDWNEAEQWLTANPFYDQVAPAPVRCNAQPVDVVSSSDEQLREHFEQLMECTMRVWQPPTEKAGWTLVRPSVTIYGKEFTSKCGTTGVNAFYCSADQNVYFSNQLHKFIPAVADEKWAADVVMAHEFGHALQGRTGILVSSAALGARNNSKDEQRLQSRRREVQADCLSAMFMRSVSSSLGIQQSDVDGIMETYRAVGDDVASGDPTIEGDHGLARSRVLWATRGLGTDDVGVCNSFVAPDSEVR